jgi:hypothetical protein
MGKLPNSFVQADWRNTTPIDSETGRAGVGFNLENGEVLRLSLCPQSVRNLVETLLPYVDRTQSVTSSGIPSIDVSTPLDGEKV